MRWGLVAAAAAVAWATPASAAEIIGAGSAYAGYGGSAHQFDPSLGTLRSVTLSLAGYSASISGASYSNDSRGNPVTTRFYVTSTPYVTLMVGNLALQIAITPTTSYYDVTGGGPTNFRIVSQFNGVASAPAATTDVASFIGTSDYSWMSASSSGFGASVRPDPAPGVVAGYNPFDYDQSIRFFLTYSYDPAGSSVPEPASWALMILGVGAVGGALRRPGPRRSATA